MTWEEIMSRVLPPVGGLSPQTTGPGAFGAGVQQGRRPPSTIPHKGVDFNFPVGQAGINKSYPVLHSPVAGVVVNAGEGNVGRIAIRDANGFTHEILHTATRSVKKGDLVGVGTPIGTMGNTGVNHEHPERGDYHVHYQLKDRAGNVINPARFWNYLDADKSDPSQPAFLDRSGRAAEIMSGGSASSASGMSSPDTPAQPFFSPFGKSVSDPNAFADRFGKWGSAPLPNASAAFDGPASFADRFDRWDLRAPGALRNVSAPAPQVPDQGKRLEADDSAPVRVLSRRADLSPASGDASPLAPETSPPLLGIVSGQPMRDYPVRPSIFETDDRSSPDDDELVQRWTRWVDV